MKAFEILKTLVKGEIDIDHSGIAESDAIIVVGWQSYFGARWIKGSIQPGKNYFYAYLAYDEELPSMPFPDVYLEDDACKGCIKLWEIEN